MPTGYYVVADGHRRGFPFYSKRSAISEAKDWFDAYVETVATRKVVWPSGLVKKQT